MVLIAGSWEREIGLIRKSWLPLLPLVVCDKDHRDLNTKRVQSSVIAFLYERAGHFNEIFSASIRNVAK